MKRIYTIGYSGFTMQQFIDVLKKYKISCVVDVRSRPYSRIYPDYNMKSLNKKLKTNKILYRHYGEAFGARQSDIKYYTNGYLDFEKFTKSNVFLSGIEKIEAGVQMGYTFVFMCAEKDPITCHRNIMITRYFESIGYTSQHILHDNNIESQLESERRLVEFYYPNRYQQSLFEESLSWEDMVTNSYKQRNKEIGYQGENSKERE